MNIARAFLIAVCLGSMLPAFGADDDLTSSAYLVFDPETGEFVTVLDPDRTKQNHAARDPAAVADAGPQPSPQLASIAMTIALIAAAVWLQLRKGKT